jgi:hypothetical protein
MAVIISDMNMPKSCKQCPVCMEVRDTFAYCMLLGFQLKLSELDLKDGYCPLKSTDEIKNELIDKSWNIDMYDDDLDFECMYLSDVLKIVDKYCKGAQNDKNQDFGNRV